MVYYPGLTDLHAYSKCGAIKMKKCSQLGTDKMLKTAIVKFHLLAKWAANGTHIKCVKHYHGIESTSADLAQSQNHLGIEALDLTGEGDINEINDIDSDDVPSSSSFHAFL